MTGAPRRERPPALLCDAMLGRLARWLRTLGYDTAYAPDTDDAHLLRIARREGRVLLTRDTRLAPRLPGAVLLRGNDPLGQLAEVRAALGLGRPPGLFRRCTVCNAPLGRASPSAVEGRVPEHVRAVHARFFGCRGCGRVYWPGTHRRGMSRAIAAVLRGGRTDERPGAARPLTAPGRRRGSS